MRTAKTASTRSTIFMVDSLPLRERRLADCGESVAYAVGPD